MFEVLNVWMFVLVDSRPKAEVFAEACIVVRLTESKHQNQ
jgi:hypothetical protein